MFPLGVLLLLLFLACSTRHIVAIGPLPALTAEVREIYENIYSSDPVATCKHSCQQDMNAFKEAFDLLPKEVQDVFKSAFYNIMDFVASPKGMQIVFERGFPKIPLASNNTAVGYYWPYLPRSILEAWDHARAFFYASVAFLHNHRQKRKKKKTILFPRRTNRKNPRRFTAHSTYSVFYFLLTQRGDPGLDARRFKKCELSLRRDVLRSIIQMNMVEKNGKRVEVSPDLFCLLFTSTYHIKSNSLKHNTACAESYRRYNTTKGGGGQTLRRNYCRTSKHLPHPPQPQAPSSSQRRYRTAFLRPRLPLFDQQLPLHYPDERLTIPLSPHLQGP